MSLFQKVIPAAALFLLASTGSTYAYDVPLRPFSDITNRDWFQEEVYSLSALGIIDGYPDATYQPDGMLTRKPSSNCSCRRSVSIQPSLQAQPLRMWNRRGGPIRT